MKLLKLSFNIKLNKIILALILFYYNVSRNDLTEFLRQIPTPAKNTDP